MAALCAAPTAPFFALLLAAFAANKVQGFALTKAAGVLFIPPMIAYFVDLPWQWLFGLDPLYWPIKLFWQLYYQQSGWGLVLVVGLLYQSLILALLLRRFRKLV